MIVSLRHRFIFLAVPRTASHAIRAALRPIRAPGDWEQEGLLSSVRSPLLAIVRMSHDHVTLRQVRRHLPETVWRSSFTFAIARNPYDRYVSACAMLNGHNPEYAGNETAVMKRMLAALHGSVDASVFRRLMLLRPQTDLLMDEAGGSGSISSAGTKTCRERSRRSAGASASPNRGSPASTLLRTGPPTRITTMNCAAW